MMSHDRSRRGHAIAALLGLAATASACGAANPRINEIDADTPGTDRAEFVELSDGGTGHTALDGYVLVFYNGATDASYAAYDLDGAATTAAGYYVLGNAGVPGVGTVFSDNTLQNGQDAVALYHADADRFPRGTPVTTTGLVDAVVYGTGDADDPGLAPLLVDGAPQLDEDGGGDKDQVSLQRVPDSSGHARDTRSFTRGMPSPGAMNTPDNTGTGETTHGAALTGQRIHDIQGAAQTSPLAGRQVEDVPGRVTAVRSSGFTLQDPARDDDPATSEAISVYTGHRPTTRSGKAIVVGDALTVSGQVVEYYAGDDTDNLPVTEISVADDQDIVALSDPGLRQVAAAIEPVMIGPDGRQPPSEIIEDDARGRVTDDGVNVFDPAQDGLDFYESLESMQVEIDDARIVSPNDRYGEFYVLADNGKGATGTNERGGITIVNRGDHVDYNPERIEIRPPGGADDAGPPDVNVGAHLSRIVGTLDYAFGQFVLRPARLPAPSPSALQRETAQPLARGDTLSLASYNVENLDPNDNDGDTDVADGKFEAIAHQIVDRLDAPDIVALQEVQDNDGSSAANGVTAADDTLGRLVDAIAAAGGPRYAFTEIAPVAGADGGQPGGNIRTAYLYDPERVSLADVGAHGDARTGITVAADPHGQLTLSANPGRIEPDDPAFTHSRKPLAALFVFHGQRLLVVNNHFTSKGGSTSRYGAIQPPVDGGRDKRTRQGDIVNAFIDRALAVVPEARIALVGDFNSFVFEPPLRHLTGADDGTNVAADLLDRLAAPARYSYVYQGNSQALDHVFATPELQRALREIDVVHVNAEFHDQISDHDPSRAVFDLP